MKATDGTIRTTVPIRNEMSIFNEHSRIDVDMYLAWYVNVGAIVSLRTSMALGR